MRFDPLEELRAAGQPVDALNLAQQEVLRGLSRAEAATLISVQARIAAVSADVEGHASVWGIGVF